MTLLTLVFGGQNLNNANAVSDTRTISLFHIHSKEELTITYKKNGAYDEEALKKLNWFFRDWRKNAEIKMDPHLIDMIWEVHRETGSKQPIHIVCGYRSPETNAMLRSRTSGVARFSQHMLGKAIDFSIVDKPVEEVRIAALRLQGGGVGYYPTSGIPFVHMDIGSVRHWPRMTPQQMARAFPNGQNPRKQNSIIAALSTSSDDEDATESQSAKPQIAALTRRLARATVPPATAAAPAPAPVVVAAAPVAAPAPAAAPAPQVAPVQVASAAPEAKPVPLPPSRPTFEIASAETRLVPAPARRANTGAINLASLSANDVISARGYWQGLPDATSEASAAPAARRVPAPAQQTASADQTGTVGPFQRDDRVPAMAYAPTNVDPPALRTTVPAAQRAAPAAATQQTAAIAPKPAPFEASTPARPTAGNTARMDDPWIRGVMLAPSVQTAMTTTVFGAPDFRSLRPFLQKPASSVMMTFSADPYLGMTTDRFTGSAIVFQATVTYGMRTAGLQ